jgi:hypothetical protein
MSNDKHQVLESIVLTPKNEYSTATITHGSNDPFASYGRERPSRIEWNEGAFTVDFNYKPSEKKQKLLDAGFSDVQSNAVLEILGLK